MTKMLFITGAFRSGSTLLSRALNAHPEIAMAADPALSIFKAFRSNIAASLNHRLADEQSSGRDNLTCPIDAPFSDYYFDPEGIKLFDAIQEASLDLEIPPNGAKAIREAIFRAVKAAEGSGCPATFLLDKSRRDKIDGTTYAEILRSTHEQIAKALKPDATVVGHKEVWTNEFIPAILKSFPDAKIIVITATCAPWQHPKTHGRTKSHG